MANDNLLAAIAGAVEGAGSVLTPYLLEGIKEKREARKRQVRVPKELAESLGIQPGEVDERVLNAATRTTGSIYDQGTGEFVRSPYGKPAISRPARTPYSNGVEEEKPNLQDNRLGFQREKFEYQKEQKEEQLNRIPSDQAGRSVLASQSIKNIDNTFKVLFPKGTPESFRRDIATESNLPAGALGKDAQNVRRWMRTALSGRQLIQTGVAARPEETQQLYDAFIAGITSHPESAFASINELKDFYTEYIEVLKTKRVPESKPDAATTPPAAPGKPTPKTGGVEMKDAQGNRAIVYPDGSFEEIK